MNIIVTGATKGIGRAIVEKYAAGNHTIIVCARSSHDLDEMSQEIKKQFPGCDLKIRTVDMAAKDQVKEFGNWILTNNWVPDILVNNAGQFYPGSVHSEDDGVLEKTMEVNLYSAYHLTRVLLPAMIERKKGHIFNMCSIASLQAYANGGAYSISKFALLGFSKNLREEMKPFGIKVTAVCPGATMSNSWKDSGIDAERIMEAGDIAELIYAAGNLSPMAVVEDIIVRPQLGDL